MVENTFSRIDGIYIISSTVDKDVKIPDNDIIVAEKHSIDDAIKATGYGRFHLFQLFVCGFALMCVVVENVNIGFVLPYVRCEMDISTTEQGLLNSVSYAGIVISSHMWGFLADTTGRRRVMVISMSASFVFAILSAFSFNVISLIVTRLLVGIFVSGTQASTYSYIGEFHSNATRTKTLSFVAMFMPACFLYLPLLAWLILPMEWEFNLFDIMQFSPWRVYLICSCLLNGLNFLCLYQLPESPKFLLSVNRKEETLDALRKVYSINTGNDRKLYPIKDLITDSTGTALSEVHGFCGILKLIWNQTWPLFQRPHVGKTIKLCYLMAVLFSIGHGTFAWYPDFLTKMQDYTDGYTLCSVVGRSMPRGNATGIEEADCNFDRSNTVSFKIILMMGTVFVGISALISFYIDKIDRKKLLTGWLLCCSVFSVSISLIPNFYIMAICFMVFLSCGLCAGIISAISVAVFPTNIRAMATCLILMSGRFGSVSGGNFVGLMLEKNCELIFYLYGALILSCAILCIFLNTTPVEQKTQDDIAKEIKCDP